MIAADQILGVGADAWLLLGGAGTVISVLFKLLIGSKDRELSLVIAEKDRVIADLSAERTNNRKLATDSIAFSLEQTNFYRQMAGKKPLTLDAAVIPNSQSPSTQKQRDDAEFESLKATLAKVKLEIGTAPTPTPEHAIEAGPSLPLH